MKNICGHIRKLLADYGPSALKNDAAALDHVENCSPCFAFLEAISEINESLENLPIFDVSDATVQGVLEDVAIQGMLEKPVITKAKSVNAKQARIKKIKKKQSSPFFGRIKINILEVAVVVVILGIAGMLVSPRVMHRFDVSDEIYVQTEKAEKETKRKLNQLDSKPTISAPSAKEHSGAYKQNPPPYAQKRDNTTKAPKPSGKKESNRTIAGKSLPADPAKDDFRQDDELKGNRKFRRSPGVEGGLASVRESSKRQAPKPMVSSDSPEPDMQAFIRIPDPAEPESFNELDSVSGRLDHAFMDMDRDAEEEPVFKNKSLGREKLGAVHKPAELPESSTAFPRRTVGTRKYGTAGTRKSGTGKQPETLETVSDVGTSETRSQIETWGTGSGDGTVGADEGEDAEDDLTARLLAERSDTEPPAFKEAAGYWANTYVPGDPVVRRLESRLRDWDRGPLFAKAGGPLALESAARKPFQPFDPPDNAAIGVFLSADRSAAREKSRMLIQVGLMGTSRFSGSRPAMNVGMVFDLAGDLPPGVSAGFRALLFAFAKSKDMGDRFSLTVAGKPGGQLIRPGDFNHGHVTVASKRLFEEEAGEGPDLTLDQAVKTAIETVAGADDPTAPLGSSLVVIATYRPLGHRVRILSEMAHESAVAGVPISGIGIGPTARMDQLEEIVLSGQGNRRLLETPANAEALVERELSAVGRVVARTVRLRIRLAPGVKLVDVIGSKRLDETRAEQVRQAEKSIDLRLARNLGIQSDRGEDEDGIQIVIPNFYAGDSHAILIDTVVPGPGPVADVTVRFKDLVKLKNGTVRANLTLSRGDDEKGPLERNVMKNYLAFRLSETLEQAGMDLARGNWQPANFSLIGQLILLQELRESYPGFARDPDLVADFRMLGEYQSVLSPQMEENWRTRLADSLRLAGRLKISPRSVNSEQ